MGARSARSVALLIAAVVLALARASAAADYYDYAYDSYYDEKAPVTDDEFGYYGNDDSLYYEEYGYYANDAFGYDDYYDAFDKGKRGNVSGAAAGASSAPGGGALQDCVMLGGKPQLANGTAPCAISIKGVDKKADLLTGGVDGTYKLTSCHNGRPLYVREKSPKGEDRVLWYSTGFGDWDISNGTLPNEAEILMYGGDTQHAVVPLYVTAWHLGADLNSDANGMGDDDYFPVDAKVACADGKVYEEPKYNAALDKAGPVLTDDEIEAKYRFVYEKYGRRPDPNPTVNFSFIVLLVVAGLGTVLAIPYLLIYQRDAKAKAGYAPVATTSFAQIIQQSKKKQSGHIN